MRICQECSGENPQERTFCTHCGAFLGWEDDPPSLAVADDARPEPVIELTDAPVTVEAADARQEAIDAREEAARVRDEAATRARVATDDAVRVISEQTSRARIDALAKIQVEVDDVGQQGGDVDEARRRAEAEARHEIDRVELRAARRARRAREEAYSQARKEAADADKVASDKAERAAALLAPESEFDLRAPEGTLRRETPQPIRARVGSGDTGSGDTGSGAAGGGAVGLGQATIRAGHAPSHGPVIEADAPAPRPGDVACWSCAETNPASRHFCRRCGSVLVAPLGGAGRRQNGSGHQGARAAGGPNRRNGLGLGRQATQAKRTAHRLSSLRSKSRGVLAVALVIGAVVGLSHQSQVASGLDSIRTDFAPKPVYVTPEVAFQGNNQSRPIPALTQTQEGPHPFTSTRQSTSVPVFSVAPGVTGGVAAPISLYAVGFVIGRLNQTAAQGPLPHHIDLVAYGPTNPEPLKAKTVTLKNATGFQSFHFEVSDVNRVAVYVVDTYPSSGAGAGYVVDQVELFKRT